MAVLRRKAKDGAVIWAVRRVVSGERVFKSFGSGTGAKRAAERFEAELAAQEKAGRLGVELNHTVGEALEASRDAILSRVRNSSVPTYRGRLEVLKAPYGHLRLDTITRALAADVQSMLSGKGLGAKTTNDYLTLMSRILASAVDRGWLFKNPLAGTARLRLPDPFSTWRSIPPDHLATIIAAAHPSWFQDAIVGLAETGMRRSELRGIRWEDIGDEVIRIVPYEGRLLKGPGSARVIPLPSTLLPILECHKAAGHAMPFGQHLGNLIPINSLSTKWVSHVAVLGLAYRLHDLRHTYACRLASAGVNPAAAQKVLGHSRIEVTLRYYRLTEDDILRQVRNALECHESATP